MLSLKALEKLYHKLQKQYIFAFKNVVINAATVVLAELIGYNRIFTMKGNYCQKEGDKVPHTKSPLCQVWQPQVMWKFRYVFSLSWNTWSKGHVTQRHPTLSHHPFNFDGSRSCGESSKSYVMFAIPIPMFTNDILNCIQIRIILRK